ncbi:hypothetical protein ERJ75_001761600 [Trypanosoma vivax]|nr:hypothetical protein TRVL_08988 [Trypanosoma vivax]KAH8603991.1 hypothetical protein ERJ75_001761600 [Trypanosoma vivax]
MPLNGTFRLAVLLAVAALCCGTTFGVAGAKKKGKPVAITGEEKTHAACKWVEMYKMFYSTFAAIYEIASNASSTVEEFMHKIDKAWQKAVVINDSVVIEQIKKANYTAADTDLQLRNSMELVSQTNALIISHFHNAGTVIKHHSEFKNDVERFLKNFTVCTAKYNITLRNMKAAKIDIELNLSKLSNWKEKTKKSWDESMGSAWKVIEKFTRMRPKWGVWKSVQETLKEQLEKVVIPLTPGMLKLTVVRDNVVKVEAETASKVKEVTQELVQEHMALCNVRGQLSAMSSLLGKFEGQLITKAAELEKNREREKTHMQAIKKYITTLKTVVPRSDFATTAMGHGQQLGTTPLTATAQPATGKLAVYDAEKVKDGTKEMGDRVALTLKFLEGHMESIKQKATLLSGKHGITEKCGVPVHEITPNTLEAIKVELPADAKRQVIFKDLQNNLTIISDKWVNLHKSMAELDRDVEAARSAMNAAETQSKETEVVIKKELAAKQEALCKAIAHLNAIKRHHSSLEARTREAQSAVQEAKKHEDSAGAEVKLIQKGVRKFAAMGARTQTAVVRAMGACRAAEAAVEEKDADVLAIAADACAAAKRADDEGRETERMSSAVKEFEKGSGIALAEIRESVKRTSVAEGTALKSKENITGALQKIEAVVERVEKTFNDAVKQLEEFWPSRELLKCSSTPAEKEDEVVENFEANMQTLLQFVNESEGSIVNNSVTVLRESTKQFNNALNEARKFSAKAKSESEQVKAIRAAIKSSAHVARETVRRGEGAAREAQEAASRVASGCEPLHRQLLSVLSGVV